MSEEWLEELERTVHEATATIEELRAEKRELAERLEELEGKLAEAREGAGEEGGEGAEAWQQERAEIRRRVEGLTETLEGLLEDGG